MSTDSSQQSSQFRQGMCKHAQHMLGLDNSGQCAFEVETKNDVNTDTPSSCSNSTTILVWPVASSPVLGDLDYLLRLGNVAAAFLFSDVQPVAKLSMYPRDTQIHPERDCMLTQLVTQAALLKGYLQQHLHTIMST